ncbi:hypothetical protein, partial [Paraburkholderia sp. C35]|uniref:hypothetical protein n=1 Tax=Paraburkholderia sp. C35 TaxID=2126993 RepID=UPI00195170D1
RFFFKQQTAADIGGRRVGSEMRISDSPKTPPHNRTPIKTHTLTSIKRSKPICTQSIDLRQSQRLATS